MINILSEDFKNHWNETLSNEAYHADKTAVSSSGLKHLIKSPKHFKKLYLETESSPDTTAMRFGRIVHLALLEPNKFKDKVKCVPDFGDLRLVVNREKKKEWLAGLPEGVEFVSTKEYDALLQVIDSVIENKSASSLIKGGVFECSGFFRDPETGISCKIRPDIMRLDLAVLPDVKTSSFPDKETFSREIWKYRYDVQMAFYMLGIECITGKRPEIACFIVVEKEPPFEIQVFECDVGMINRGDTAVRILLNRLHECVKNNHFPGRQGDSGPQIISLPNYTDSIEYP